MDIQIREGIISDSHAIDQITQYELGYMCGEELLKIKLQAALASEREKVFVALCDEKVVGYIHAENYEVLYYPSMKNLLGFAVLRDYQRKGIGTRLLNAVEQWAKETGAYGVRLNSGKIRRDAHAFYRLRGYDSEKEQIRFIKKLQ